MDRLDLQSLAKVRIAEARRLLEGGMDSGAYYLAGYAVEYGLKASYAKRTRSHEFPDKRSVNAVHTHDLGILMRLVGLEETFGAACARDPLLALNWTLVSAWNAESRYKQWEAPTARALVDAVDDGEHGVLSWLSRHW